MKEISKNCNSCKYSYYQIEHDPNGGERPVGMQHCAHPVYASPAYTDKMLLEDMESGHCRFWSPNSKKGKNHEE